MSELSIRKVYVDSRYRDNQSSSSSSDFRVNFKQSLNCSEGSTMVIDDICIPYVWYTVEEDFNDRVYIEIKRWLGNFAPEYKRIVLKFPKGNYSSEQLAVEFINQLNAKKGLTDLSAAYVGADYVSKANTIQITLSDDTGGVHTGLRVLTDEDLKNLSGSELQLWEANPDFYSNATANEIIGNFGISSWIENYSDYATWTSGFLNMLSINNLYLHCINIGDYSTLGPNGQSTIVRKIPITSSYGTLIFDRLSQAHDYVNVSNQCITYLDFKLTDSRGRVIDLHGLDVSFTITFLE